MKMAKSSPRQALLLAASALVLASLACRTTAGRAPTPTSSAATAAPTPLPPDQFTAEVFATAPDTVMALAVDQAENVYAVTIGGALLRIASDGSVEQVYTGIERCGFSDRVVAALPSGDVVVNHCVDTKDTLLRIDQAGNTTTLLQLDESLTTMTSDATGNLYLGFWTSEGNISVEFNPSYLSGADYLAGQIAVLRPGGQLENLYEGGIPLSIAASGGENLYAALWGRPGPFQPEQKSYTMCGPTKNFWIALSDQGQIVQIKPGQGDVSAESGWSGTFSYVATGQDGMLYAFGSVEGKPCGVYRIAPTQQPERLELAESGVDKKITTLAVSANAIYFADMDGNVYRASLVSSK